MKPIIMLEFNELCPTLMETFISEGKLPNFKKLRDQSEAFTTDAGEDRPHLEPWIQWIDVHTGVPFKEHRVFSLGEGDTVKFKSVWDYVSDAGYPVWICGSMNLKYEGGIRGSVVPDPWTTKILPTPSTLAPFFAFVQRNVLEHTKEDLPVSTGDQLQFLKFMMANGLSLSTLFAIQKQLLSERFNGHRWRRAFLLDMLQFDLFESVYRRTKPLFSTFFLNSTAHMQHMYWRNMEPELFKQKPSPEEQRKFESAILVGYQEMDAIVGKFLKLSGGEATLILATALSQQPCVIYDDEGGKLLYRPHRFEKLLHFAGIHEGFAVAPVMAEQFHVYFDKEEDAIAAERNLKSLRAGDEAALSVRRQGIDVFAGCRIYHRVSQDLTLSSGSGDTALFRSLFYQIEGVKSGMHHRDGILWIQTGKRGLHSGQVPLTAIAPTILSLLSLPVPTQMKGDALPLLGLERSRAGSPHMVPA